MKRIFFLTIIAVASFFSLSASYNDRVNARLTADEIKAEIAKASEYQSYLTNLFVDLSCFKLKDGITPDNLPTNENYNKLSTPLKKMVDKIANDDWQEDYSELNLKDTYPLLDEVVWDGGYAKKYRVQDYEPYSESIASEMVGVSRYTNMNNPTGIVGDKGELIYIMVKDAVPQGATLYINEVWNPAEMYNSATGGTQLKQGLNIIECKNDNSHFFIYYCVTTAKLSNGKYVADETRNLKNYQPLTIHIEGGRLNGFFNYVGDSKYVGDTQKDFEYTVQRATHPMYNLIGKHVILHFHLEDSPGVVGGDVLYPCVKTVLFRNKGQNADREYDPVKIMTAWDKMCLTERILMGLQSDDDIKDPYNQGLYESNATPYTIQAGGQSYKASPGFQYNEYFNNKLFGMSRQAEGLFMSAGDWRTSYNVYTIEAVLTQFNKGDIWGPAHEYGHMNQRLINMAGTTEESNNIFSNVVVYFQGKNTSRSDFISSQFEIFQAGKPFLENGTWGTTRMFWQLWCYYHATGHNKKFYPRLFELLRNYPIVKTTRPGKHNERYDKLQFAKMCCLAAEEDLTDFFTAWGFFVPLELYSFADYQTYDTYLTEADIQAVKDEIAAFGFDKNEAIIFIDDRVNSNRASYDGFPKEKAGDFGGLDAFKENRAPQGNFDYSIDINKVTVFTDGDPGAGFIIRDKQGNLLGFSNSKTFTVNDELAEKLRNGEALMEAVGANNDVQKVNNLISEGTIEQKTDILKRILASASELLNYVDPTRTKVGYLLKEKTVTLNELVTEIDYALKEGNLSSVTLTDYINKLTEEFNRLTADDEAFIQLEAGSLYMLTNSIRRPTDALSYSNNNCTMATKPAKPGENSAAKFQWNFVPDIEQNTYYIQNWENKAYLDKAANGTIGLQYSGGYKYKTISARDKNVNIGQFILAPFDDMNLAIHIGGNGAVIGYTSEAGASKWYITKVKDASELDLSEVYKSQIQSILNKYKELKPEIDPEGVNVGYLKPEVQNIIDKNCALINAVLNDENYTSEQYKAFYEEQMDLFRNLKGAELRIDIEPGAAYMIRNIDDPTRIMYTNDGNYLGTNDPNSSKKFEGQWVFEVGKTARSFVIRNLSNDKYISKVNQINTKIPLNEEGAEFTLVDYPEELGHYGIIADGNVSNALVNGIISEGNIDYKMVIMTFLSNDAGKWRIVQVHDKEYVSLHDKLGELIRHAQELFYLPEFWNLENWMEILMLYQDLTAGDGPYKNPETEKEELQKWVDELDSNLSYADALIQEEEIITVESIGRYNDGVDNDGSQQDGIIRHAFNISESITFDDIISIPNLDDPSNVMVTVEPIKNSQWVSSDATDATSLMNEYADVFNKTAPGSGLLNQLQSLECEYVDGFFTSASGELRASGDDSDFDLVLQVPCSGLYRITLRGKDGYALFDKNNKIPILEIEVYPNLTGIFNKDRGININGYTFVDDEDHDKTINIPKDALDQMDLSNCKIYIPGLYFVNEFTAWLDSDFNSSRNIGLYEGPFSMTTTNPGASNYYATVDLSCLKEMDEHSTPERLNVSISKNGATSNFTFFVGVGDNFNVSTKVESLETNGGEPEYYNLQGIRIVNPQHGIYIKRTGNKSEKVIL